MTSFLYKHVMMNNPHLKEEDIAEYREISEWDLLIVFKNGNKVIYDTFTNEHRYISYQSDELTEEQEKYEFGFKLRQMMKRKFINQEELARRTNTTQPMISRYMKGKVLPSYLMLKKLAKALGCSIEDLYYKYY